MHQTAKSADGCSRNSSFASVRCAGLTLNRSTRSRLTATGRDFASFLSASSRPNLSVIVRKHFAGLAHRTNIATSFETKAAKRSMIARRLGHPGPGRTEMSGGKDTTRWQGWCNETRVLSLMPALRVNAGKTQAKDRPRACRGFRRQRIVFQYRGNLCS